MARKDDQLLQTGHRPSPGRNHGRGTPRIIWGALLVAMGGAFFLFRSPGGGTPSGIGENRSVITAEADDLDTLMTDIGVGDAVPGDSAATDRPRSGSVEIKDITTPLTPENPAPGAETKAAAKPEAAPAKATPPVETAAQVKAPSSRPASLPKKIEEIKPQAKGPYLVQTGSFGDSRNADREAHRLEKLGWDARVKVSNTADGSVVYRVHIGFFGDRKTAEAFIRTHRDRLRGAIAVHR